MLDEATRNALLALYDIPDATRPGRTVPGYDRDHAVRATEILLQAVRSLGVPQEYLKGLEVAGLLHDLGRAGMDSALFGRVFTIAEANGLPVRLRALRERYPHVPEAEASAFFLSLVRPHLEAAGIPIDARVAEHVRMRMAFKARFREQLDASAGTLKALGVRFLPWMERVVLYYYYPQDMVGEPAHVRLMGMLQVASENFEAMNNAQRGRDYYGRGRERLQDVFATLSRFQAEGLVSAEVIACLKSLAAAGTLDEVVRESRGLPPNAPLPSEDLAFLGR